VFTVTVAEGDAVATLDCPSRESADAHRLRCTQSGFEVRAAASSFDVTLRSRGNAFVSKSVSASTRSAEIVLEPLPAAEETENYATRLDGDECLGKLRELGIAVTTDLGKASAVKFLIRELRTRPEVYFQNTNEYPLHFEFARKVLGISGTADEFAAQTYAAENRTMVVGTLVLYPSISSAARGASPLVDAPWTLNFFPSDPITAEEVRLVHRLLEERLTCLRWSGPAERLIYLPAGSVKEAEADADTLGFERAGIGWARPADLFGGIKLQLLNPGLAFGWLKRMTPEQLLNSVVSFRDILLLSRIPGDLPIVGGTITEELQTPLSHVNVAARTRGTPNIAYADAALDPAISGLIGKLIRFEVGRGEYSLTEATLEEAEAFWSERVPEPYQPSFDSSFKGIPSFDELEFADAIRVGSKAANLVELSRVLGANAPRAGLAIPFHYYEAFMNSSLVASQACDEAQEACLNEHREATACAGARDFCGSHGASESFSGFVERMLADEAVESDTVLRDAVLANLRHLIAHTKVDPEFAAELDGRVAAVFENSRIKIRSSSNVEDLPNFSGAGLYDSYGANGDNGPAPSEVVTRVFASTWNFRAFEERSYWNIDQRSVRMGCLINQAVTDELANGVLVTENIADPSVYGMYVNVQKGETEVVNPTHGELPEIFSILGDANFEVVRQRFSSLSPDEPLLLAEEVASLYRAGDLARRHFAPLYGQAVGQLALDIEFKLTADRVIVLKQARPYTPSAR
jgi:pyruvate,water dikinase